MIRTAALLAILVLGCGSSKTDGPAARADQPPRESCVAYAKRTAELMYVGFERGGHGMAQYIEPEFTTAVSTPLVPYCMDHLPADHVRCVSTAATAQAADACLLDPAIQAPMNAFLRTLVKEAANVAELPASEAECRGAAVEAVKAMRAGVAALPGAKVPTIDQVAALCVRDKWTADYVRCTVANGKSCLSKPNVKAGVTKLVTDVQSSP